MALTATASDSTYSAIVESLHLDNPVLVSDSLNRANIVLSVSPIENMSVSFISIMYAMWGTTVLFTVERLVWTIKTTVRE